MPKVSRCDAGYCFHRGSGYDKKNLKHLSLWDIKRKPHPLANAPSSDVFPVYDEQPGPSADDYVVDPQYPDEAYY